jgi:hypothetical protein
MKGWIRIILVVLVSPSAHAIIAAKTPPSSMFAQSSAVVIGEITKMSAESGVVEVSATALSGQAPADVIKIRIEGPAEVLQLAKQGQPIVLLLGKRAASNALHLADTWLWPEPAARGNFVVRKDKQSELRQSYPGTTTALVKIMQELKAGDGKYSMLDKTSPDMFKGGTKELGKAEDLKLPELAGRTVVGNFGEDPKRTVAIVLREEGVFRQTTDTPASPADDFTRLTGESIAAYYRDNPRWLSQATAIALDCNGDGRMDVLINSPAGKMLLVNRGFGCFFVNADIGKAIGDALPPAAKWTALDVDGDNNDDLLVVGEDGTAKAVLNPAAKQ